MRDFQSGFEYLSRSKTFLHSLGQKQSLRAIDPKQIVSRVLEHDFHLHVVELQNTGPLTHMALASLVAFASGLLGRPAQGQMVVLGDMSLGGNITPVESIAECLQVAFDAGGKRVALPMSSAVDLPTIPPELFTKFQTSFYADPVDAVIKALGVD